MFLEETEIRRALAERRAPTGDPWTPIRTRLERKYLPTRRAAGWALALILFFAAAETFRSTARLRRSDQSDFRVTRVISDGRPANALVVQPDANTIVVIPQ
jgi:hypothetical protein